MKGEYDKAAELYGAAVGMARAKVANHRSSWKQACRLMEKLSPSDAERAVIRKEFEHIEDCAELVG